MHTSLFITCAMVTIEIHWCKQRFLSLVIYGLPGTFDANIENLYIKLKLKLSSISCYGRKVSRVRFKKSLDVANNKDIFKYKVYH